MSVIKNIVVYFNFVEKYVKSVLKQIVELEGKVLDVEQGLAVT